MTTTTPLASIQAEVAAIFARDLHIDVHAPDTDLLTTGRLDSIGMVELLLQLENHFGVRAEMDDLEIDHFRSIAAIASFITTRHNADR